MATPRYGDVRNSLKVGISLPWLPPRFGSGVNDCG